MRERKIDTNIECSLVGGFFVVVVAYVMKISNVTNLLVVNNCNIITKDNVV